MIPAMRTLLLVPLGVACACLAACNTMIGISRDIRAAGAGMENVARGRDFNDPNAPLDLEPDTTSSSRGLSRPNR